ncbi:hypothetical protein [Halococcus agarilyticus]|uniref:hypothetical protein n=1 Tax=Halococcus agarilyticus TaxID=1232219 RepID=UPI00067823AE|nr:hypothetical protein [Halococcus agarilyticus]
MASRSTDQASANTLVQWVRRPRRRTVVLAFGAYFLLLFLTMMPPFFSIVNRAEPYVFGLSFVLFWTLLISLLMSLGLSVLYWVELKRGEVV